MTSVGFRRHLSDVDAVAFHPNAHYLATGSVDKSLRLWELRAGPCVRVLAAHTPIHALAFSPCGQYLAAAGGGDGAVLLWCGPSLGLSNPVRVAPPEACSSRLCRDIPAAKVAATLRLGGGGEGAGQPSVWSLDYSACGKMLAAAHSDGAVTLWDSGTLRNSR